MRVTILGCGGSNGVPALGGAGGRGDWGRCDPTNPKNRRRRVGILVEEGPTRLLVDTSPDLREQLLDAGADSLSAVLYTHEHADHSHGLHELRRLSKLADKRLDVYADPRTLKLLSQRFAYAFVRNAESSYPPILTGHELNARFTVGGLEIRPFEQDHGLDMRSIGYRIGSMAYSTDVHKLDEAAFGMLEGIELWIVDCLREAPHPTHSHFAQTLEWIARVNPKRAILTHMDESVDYETLRAKCPPGVEPAFDGMVVELG
ncbi:MAG: MBL fold metallo-hydrolase [Alphaproteobacteria bacterium]